MKRCHRKGYALVQLLGWLPLLAAASTVAYGLLTRTLQFQAQETRQINAASVACDLVRCFQKDVWHAEDAQRRDELEGESLLTVTLSDRTVICYAASDQGVTRTEEGPDGAERCREWHIPRGAVQFQIEQAGATGQVVWITLNRELPSYASRGWGWPHTVAAAARVGRGGDG